MSVKRALISTQIALLASLSLAACAVSATRGGEIDESDSSDEARTPSNDPDDTAVAPLPDAQNPAGDPSGDPAMNGQHISESAACEAILGAQEANIKSLGCFITTRTCPSLVQMMTGVACVEYDAGSVQGCIERYKAASTCQDLEDAISACLVAFYPAAKSADCE